MSVDRIEEWGFVDNGKSVLDKQTDTTYIVKNQSGRVFLQRLKGVGEPMQFDAMDAIDHQRFEIKEREP